MSKKEKEVKEVVVETVAQPETVEVEIETTPELVSEFDFEVAEPHIVKPQDLPLVVKPAAGKEWANDEQAEYARTVNGYAYKNPKKWGKKKAKLLNNLKRLANEPELINVFRGADEQIEGFKYSNKLIEG